MRGAEKEGFARRGGGRGGEGEGSREGGRAREEREKERIVEFDGGFHGHCQSSLPLLLRLVFFSLFSSRLAHPKTLPETLSSLHNWAFRTLIANSAQL